MKSILQSDDGVMCFYWGQEPQCQGWATETHHCIGGSHSNRVFCEEDGLTVRVCRRCHDKLHSSSTMMYKLRAFAQEKWEARSTAENPRKAWIRRYGKNYREEDEGEENEIDT